MQMTREERVEAWMREWGDLVVRTCALILSDRHLAQDAAQETFLKAWQAADRFEGRASEKTWLMHIAVNTCRSMKRSAWWRHNDRRVIPEDLPISMQEGDRELMLDVRRLPDKLRRAVVLRYFSDCTYEEIGAIERIDKTTARARVHKALRILRIGMEVSSHD